MTRTERARARLHRRLTIGGFDCYSIFDGNTKVITDLMIPAGTAVRYVEVV